PASGNRPASSSASSIKLAARGERPTRASAIGGVDGGEVVGGCEVRRLILDRVSRRLDHQPIFTDADLRARNLGAATLASSPPSPACCRYRRAGGRAACVSLSAGADRALP